MSWVKPRTTHGDKTAVVENDFFRVFHLVFRLISLLPFLLPIFYFFFCVFYLQVFS